MPVVNIRNIIMLYENVALLILVADFSFNFLIPKFFEKISDSDILKHAIITTFFLQLFNYPEISNISKIYFIFL